MKKISAVYKITNTISGEFYVGSSKNVKRRWTQHKWPSTWKQQVNSRMYQDMQKYGTQAFTFEILAEFPPEHLKRKEQEAIETLHPTYNSCAAYVEEGRKAYKKAYNKAYHDVHREERKAKDKAYYNAHKEEIKARKKAYWKDYYKAHSEEEKARQKAYRETNKIKKKAILDEHLEPNKDTTQ